ncbi:MAG: CHAT domain-containing protein [Deltaproteobacteria bacterium]|nr:CHAT domain-containing protein [Deltaproteobacteria bacterium]
MGATLNSTWALRPKNVTLISLLIIRSVLSCGAPLTQTPPPKFAKPQHGVFITPLPLVTTPDDELSPSFSPYGHKLAYAAKSAGNLDIFVRTNNGAAERLTTDSTDDTDPAFSPNGKYIAWVAQSEDVKGDIWIMDADGSSKKRLTDRSTSDLAPVFSGDSRSIYFNTLLPDSLLMRIDRLELDSGLRQTVVSVGWDPAPTPDGEALFYAAPDKNGQARLFAMRLRDGKTITITDGAYVEGIPHVARDHNNQIHIIFCRFIDDESNDTTNDKEPMISLWSVPYNYNIFNNAQLPTPIPLTSGAENEILASSTGNWMAYTSGRGSDLDINALPQSGIIDKNATADAILNAARAEDNGPKKRLGLRFVVATEPTLVAAARYELGRELAERNRLSAAIDELQRVVEHAGNSELGIVAQIEIMRLKISSRLNGRSIAREADDRKFVQQQTELAKTLASSMPQSDYVSARSRSFSYEAAFILGQRGKAVNGLESLVAEPNINPEDGARALDRLGEIYLAMGEYEAVARVSKNLLLRFSNERYYAQRTAQRWVDATNISAIASPLAALEAINHAHADLPAVASRAALAMAKIQSTSGAQTIAINTWQYIAATFVGERKVVADALQYLGAAYEKSGDHERALLAYERMLADFADMRSVRTIARQGLVRIATRKAIAEELNGELEKARESYHHLISNDREIVTAHRHYIALSAELGHLNEVIATYKREADANPRDKFARYGYGYSLTFESDLLRLDEAEQEIRAVLELDSRFAAAHLTMGWIRERYEKQKPNRGWLEAALESYETAQQLVDFSSEPELWAGATKNRGNALFALGKSDLAFEAYLARELCGQSHVSALAELLYRESFARVALRQVAYDVALDMAHAAYLLSVKIKNKPRLGPITALLGSIYLLTASYSEARVWYDSSASIYRQRKDWARLVPLLRGKAIAEQGLQLNNEALLTLNEILDILSQGKGPPEPPHSIFITEIPGNPKNITRAAYGFSKGQEDELARALAIRTLRKNGNLAQALTFDKLRLKFWQNAAKDKKIAPRIYREYVLALNESALLSYQADKLNDAHEHLLEAINILYQYSQWSDLAVLCNSLSWIIAFQPEFKFSTAIDKLVEKLNTIVSSKDIDDKTKQNISRVLSLWLITGASVPIEITDGQARKDLKSVLTNLDAHTKLFTNAITYAENSGDTLLNKRLQNIAKTIDTTNDNSSKTLADSKEYNQITGSDKQNWRHEVDNALGSIQSQREQAWLAAITAFEQNPEPLITPERSLLLESALNILKARNENERAWKLLERERLLTLVPPLERVANPSLQEEWVQIRDLRNKENYQKQLADASSLIHALEGQPVALKTLLATLKDDIFIQIFAPTKTIWHWFIINQKELQHVTTAPIKDNEIPAAIAALLANSSTTKRIYIDAGELFTQPAWSLKLNGDHLIKKYEVIEELSSTYFVAANQLRNIARHGTLIWGEGKSDHNHVFVDATAKNIISPKVTEKNRLLVQITLKGKLQPSHPKLLGYTQVIFNDELKPDISFDLNALTATDVHANIGIAANLDDNVRSCRAVSQALLLAGIPTAILGKYDGDSKTLRDHFYNNTNTNAATIFHRLTSTEKHLPNLRLYGDPGLDKFERAKFAYTMLTTYARSAANSYKTALQKSSPKKWNIAKNAFIALLDTINYLNDPTVSKLLTKDGDKKAKAILANLSLIEVVNQINLAKVYLALDEIDAAATLWEKAISFYQQKGDAKNAAINAQMLGMAFSHAQRGQNALTAFTRCQQFATKAKQNLITADCLVNRGSELRRQSKYIEATKAYNEAISLYAQVHANDEVYPHRYLGFIYESSLSNYDLALEQFSTALNLASAKKLDELIPSLSLDVARVYRIRGEYERALAQVVTTESGLAQKNTQARSEAALEAAKIYWYRGDYRRAIKRQSQGLELALSSGNTFLEIQARSLEGLIALNQGELPRAQNNISDALNLARLTGRKSEEAVQLQNLGIVLREAGQLQEALHQFRAALAIDEKLGSIEGRAYDLRHIAITLERQGKHTQALQSLNTALELSRSIGNRYNELQCVLAQAEILEILGSAKAQEGYAFAARTSHELSLAEVEWRALYGLGRIAKNYQEIPLARDYFTKALKVVERLGRGRTEAYAGHSRDHLYEDAISLALTTNNLDEAYTYIERARARRLVDILSSGTLNFTDPQTKQFINAEMAASDAVITANRLVDRGGVNANEKLKTAINNQMKARNALKQYNQRLWRALVIKPVPLAKLQSVLPDNTTLLTYFVGPSTLTALIIRKYTITYNQLKITRDQLEAYVNRIRKGLQNFADVNNDLTALANIILSPLSVKILEKTKNLILLPHRSLFHVPFAALPLGNDLLLSKVALATAPSASVLFDRLVEAPRNKIRRIAAFAPANDLPFARLESQAVAGSQAFVGAQANKTRWFTINADAVDIAAHARLNPSDPLASSIFFAPDKFSDGHLELREIFGLHNVPSVITLSACETASSSVHGDEWLSLSNAFLTAGARTIIATQMRILDLSAALIIKRFYRELRNNSTAEALRLAALHVRKNYPHPSHWATFILSGDFR